MKLIFFILSALILSSNTLARGLGQPDNSAGLKNPELKQINNLTSVKIFSMNIHCLKDNWQFRLNHILDKIIEISPEVIAFQEVCTDPKSLDNQITYIKNYLIGRGYPLKALEAQYTHQAWDQYDEFLLMASKLEVTQADKGFLPKSLMQRGFVGFLIGNNWYLTTHLEYRADNFQSRKEQIEFLTNRFQDQAHIFMGDFNSSPADQEQSILKQKKYWAYFPGTTQNGDDGNSSNNIDGFWFSPTFVSKTQYIRAYSLLTEKVDGTYLSDHFAVFTKIDFNPQ